MAVLILDDAARRRIADAKRRARASPVPLAIVQAQAVGYANRVDLRDRKPGQSRPPPASVDLEMGFRANFSYEEQPAGLVAHLSVSCGRSDDVPGRHEFFVVARAFGFTGLGEGHASEAWIEEFARGEYAAHLAWIADERDGTDTAVGARPTVSAD